MSVFADTRSRHSIGQITRDTRDNYVRLVRKMSYARYIDGVVERPMTGSQYERSSCMIMVIYCRNRARLTVSKYDRVSGGPPRIQRTPALYAIYIILVPVPSRPWDNHTYTCIHALVAYDVRKILTKKKTIGRNREYPKRVFFP